MRIEPLTTQNFYDLNKVNQPFEIIGRIHPELKGRQMVQLRRNIRTSLLETISR